MEGDRLILELFAKDIQAGLTEIGAAPKHEPDARLLLVVTDHGMVAQERYRMRMPDQPLASWEVVLNLLTQQVAYSSMRWILALVVLVDLRLHHSSPAA